MEEVHEDIEIPLLVYLLLGGAFSTWCPVAFITRNQEGQ
jgi:hypothetical protein